MSAEEQDRLRCLFHVYDVDNSGRIERNEFLTICAELQVSVDEADRIFNRLDVDNDGTITLLEFISGFRYGEVMDSDGGDVSAAWENFERRLGEQAKFIPRTEEAATLYQNISLTEPRLINLFEKVITNFTKEIKQQNSEMENLALTIKRVQDQASMQLSEMDDEIDQRIHAAERKTREQEKKQTETALSELRRSYETEMCELQCVKRIVLTFLLFITHSYSSYLQENQRLKQELMKSQTEVACLRSEMDSLKTELTDQSIKIKINILYYIYIYSFCADRTANRKLHDSNDGLRSALERTSRVKLFGQRMDDFTLYSCRPSCDTLALAMCDPGLRHRHSSECEEDSLPEIYMDSGLSTLRGSHRGYDSEQEVKGQEEEEEKEKKGEDDNNDSLMGKNSDTEVFKRMTINPNQHTDLSYMTSEKAYRIVLAGDAAVGKSSFLLRLCKNEFKLNSSATLGVDFQMKTLIVDGEPVSLQLWDTAGQERFRSIAKSYFRRADGVLLLYDVTCEKSFLNVREWVDMIEDVSQEDIPIMLVGNKSDLRQDGASCVPTSYGEKLAMTYNTLFCETSAKDGSNILEAVLHLASRLLLMRKVTISRCPT
uniref:RAS and EF-hand domain containing n=1 Tax=Sander lucioperca TaxID=283035 RepID=A0A8C9XJ30_SANLU